MTGRPFEVPDLEPFIKSLTAIPPRPHHSALLEAANGLLPAGRFTHALSRGGWYRPGGVIGPDGERLSDDLEAWAEAALEGAGGDFDLLLERHADAGLMATQWVGRTHYFVAPTGPRPAQFLQLEVEEVQEVVDRQLINTEEPPTDLPELTDPLHPARLPAQAVSHPRYRFRRLTDLTQVLGQSSSPLGRFLADWELSSAGAQGYFCHHWIIGLQEHLDRYRNTQLNATPVSRHGRQVKPFHWNLDARNTAMADQLRAFDRAAGYPGAWYFHLVAGAITPHAIAYAIAEDLRADYRYLPTRDEAILEGWLKAPYSV